MNTVAAENADAATEAADTAVEVSDEPKKRERSTIEFPYMDLSDAVAVAKSIHTTTGSSPCQPDQLAAALSLSMQSSGFRMRIATARLFGLIESDRGSGGAKLTPLGQMIVDPSREREGKAEAFLKVPLYGKLYDLYRGKVLPPTAALEREIAALGVAQKQTDRARQAFERSATAAGFFEQGRDRLVRPGVPANYEPPKKEDQRPGGHGGDQPPRDPLIEGLFQEVPPRDTEWSAEEQVRWLETAAHIFALVFKRREKISIEIEVHSDSLRRS